MSQGWLVNDHLTCISNTKTLWHDLSENIDGLECRMIAPFSRTADIIETEASINHPDYVIRNATWFRKMNLPCKTISLMQDVVQGDMREQQKIVCENSDLVVFNSWYLRDKALAYMNPKKHTVIPVGTDFDLFKPTEEEKEYDIIFVGAANINPKGFDLVEELIHNTEYKFCLVMKDGYSCDNSRVTVHNRIDQEALSVLYNKSQVAICTSTEETLHLAGIEACACGIPVVATDVGIYNRIKEMKHWGMVSTRDNFIRSIELIIHNENFYRADSPRSVMEKMKLDKESCIKSWGNAIASVL